MVVPAEKQNSDKEPGLHTNRYTQNNKHGRTHTHQKGYNTNLSPSALHHYFDSMPNLALFSVGVSVHHHLGNATAYAQNITEVNESKKTDACVFLMHSDSYSEQCPLVSLSINNLLKIRKRLSFPLIAGQILPPQSAAQSVNKE